MATDTQSPASPQGEQGFFVAPMANATLAKPKRFEATDDDEFVLFKDVPVWKEHVNRDGVEFGPEELKRVCNQCNERIEDTGDFAPIVIRHTIDPATAKLLGIDEKRVEEINAQIQSGSPPVVGFAGPYRMGKVGKKQKSGILADFRIFKEDNAIASRFPRHSVEFWADEDDPTSGYFDPISLLGAETPELDLGIRYQRLGKVGKFVKYSRVMRYQAAAPAFPGGGNTYVPSGTNIDKTKRRKTDSGDSYAKENKAMPLAPDEIQQVVEAVMAGVDARIDEKLAERDVDPNAGLERIEGQGLEGEPLEGAQVDGQAAEPADQLDGMAEHYAKMCQYEADGDDEGASQYAKELDEDSRKGLGEFIGQNEKDEERRERMMKYMAEPSDDIDPAKAKEILADGEANGKELTDKQRGMFGAAAGKSNYSKEGTVDRYQKLEAENKELRSKYQKEVQGRRDAEDRLAAVEGKVEKIEISERHAVRYQKILQLNLEQGYAIDAEELFNDTKDLPEKEFDNRFEFVTKYGKRVPIGRSLPKGKPDQFVKDDAQKKVDRYSKRARALCEEAQAKGKSLEFGAAMKMAEEEDAKNTAKPAAAGV